MAGVVLVGFHNGRNKAFGRGMVREEVGWFQDDGFRITGLEFVGLKMAGIELVVLGMAKAFGV